MLFTVNDCCRLVLTANTRRQNDPSEQSRQTATDTQQATVYDATSLMQMLAGPTSATCMPAVLLCSGRVDAALGSVILVTTTVCTIHRSHDHGTMSIHINCSLRSLSSVPHKIK